MSPDPGRSFSRGSSAETPFPLLLPLPRRSTSSDAIKSREFLRRLFFGVGLSFFHVDGLSGLRDEAAAEVRGPESKG